LILTASLGAQGRDRTTDTVIFSHVLYQLSYLGAEARREAGLVKARGYRGSVSACPDERITRSAVIPDSPKG
jgi:hypothetical protein